MTYQIYTDGSTEPTNPGPSAYGFVVLNAKEEILHQQVGMWKRSTNQRAELKAILEGLRWVSGLTQNLNQPSKVVVYSDSKYSINCLSNWWRSWEKHGWTRKAKSKIKGQKKEHLPVKNLDLIKPGVELQKILSVKFQWVKGHSGVKWNEHVDTLVNDAALKAEILGDVDAGYEGAEIISPVAQQREYERAKLASLFA